MDTQESVSVADTSEPTEDVSNDPWGEAEQVFTEETTPEESHFEQPKVETNQEPDPLGLDKLAVPRKYKDAVRQFVEPLITERSKQAEEANQKLGEYTEAAGQLVNVLMDVAKNPDRIGHYVATYGEQLGLEPELIGRYRQPQTTQHEQRENPMPKVDLNEVTSKYAQQLLQARDEREFVDLLGKSHQEAASAIQSQVMAKMGELLKLYHENFIQPDKETLKTIQTKTQEEQALAEYHASTSSWEAAKDKVKAKFPDWDKHEPEIRKLLKTDPDFSEIREKLSKGKDNLDRRMKLIERAYKEVSLTKQIEEQNKPKPKFAGLPPTSKHVKTTKAGGDGWDDPYHKEVWGLS